VHGETLSAHPFVITKDLKDMVDALICENLWSTIDELLEVFSYFFLHILYEIFTVQM
jgi:hypothetical protein